MLVSEVTAQVRMSASSPGRPLLGVGIETLGHEIIGGVYSNLLFDESFEHPTAPHPPSAAVTSGGWFRQPGHGAQSSVDVTPDALAGNHSQRLAPGAVIFNAGLNQQSPQGFAFREGQAFTLSFYARAYANRSTNVSALLLGPKGVEPTDIPPVLASANFVDVPADGLWRRYNATLTVGRCAPLAPLIASWCNNGPSAWWCALQCCAAASGAPCSASCAAGGDGRITCGGSFAFSNSGNADVSLDYAVLEAEGEQLAHSPTKRVSDANTTCEDLTNPASHTSCMGVHPAESVVVGLAGGAGGADVFQSGPGEPAARGRRHLHALRWRHGQHAAILEALPRAARASAAQGQLRDRVV